MIITATVVPLRHARICTECQRPIEVRALRVAERVDGFHGHTVNVAYYHDAIDTVDEIRGCAPNHPLVRAALSRKKVTP